MPGFSAPTGFGQPVAMPAPGRAPEVFNLPGAGFGGKGGGLPGGNPVLGAPAGVGGGGGLNALDLFFGPQGFLSPLGTQQLGVPFPVAALGPELWRAFLPQPEQSFSPPQNLPQRPNFGR